MSQRIRVSIGVGLFIVALIAAYTFLNRGSFVSLPDRLARFYPESTLLYGEFETTPQLIKVYKTIFERTGGYPPGGVQTTAVAQIYTGVQASSQFLLDKTTFGLIDKRFSLGYWFDSNISKNDGFGLLAFPLKNPEMTLQHFISSYQSDIFSGYDQTNLQNFPALAHSSGRGVLAVFKGNLFYTADQNSMSYALAHAQKGASHVFQNTNNQKALAHLPQKNQGIFLINVKNQQEMIRVVAGEKVKKNNSLIQQTQKIITDLVNVFPVTAGAFFNQPNAIVTLKTYTPIESKSLSNPLWQKWLESGLMSSIEEFSAPDVLPQDTVLFVSLAGMDQFLDTVYQYLGETGQKRLVDTSTTFLKIMKIDIQEDLVGLFGNETTLAYRQIKDSKPGFPIVLVTDLPQKQTALNKLTKFLSMSFLPLKLREDQLEQTSFNTLLLKRKDGTIKDNTAVSYGVLSGRQQGKGPKNKMVAFATYDDMVGMIEQKQPLKAHKGYHKLLSHLPDGHQGVLMYVDLTAVHSVPGKLSPDLKNLDRLDKVIVNNNSFIQSFAGTGVAKDKQLLTGHFAFQLQEPLFN